MKIVETSPSHFEFECRGREIYELKAFLDQWNWESANKDDGSPFVGKDGIVPWYRPCGHEWKVKPDTVITYGMTLHTEKVRTAFVQYFTRIADITFLEDEDGCSGCIL